MVGGIVTATEAGAVAVLYSVILADRLSRDALAQVGPMLDRGRRDHRGHLPLLGVFNILSWILAIEQIPQAITAFSCDSPTTGSSPSSSSTSSSSCFGMFMEPVPHDGPAGPMLMPVVVKYGIDPVHFGIVFVLNVVHRRGAPADRHQHVHHLLDRPLLGRGVHPRGACPSSAPSLLLAPGHLCTGDHSVPASPFRVNARIFRACEASRPWSPCATSLNPRAFRSTRCPAR